MHLIYTSRNAGPQSYLNRRDLLVGSGEDAALWPKVGQGPTVLAAGAGWAFRIFFFVCHLPFSEKRLYMF